jgi:hypothetical protein
MPTNLTFRSGNNVTITNVETSLAVNGGSTTLQTITTKGVYTLFLDGVAAMAKGDEFTWKVYEKASTGATKRKFLSGTISDTQSEPLTIPNIMLGIGWDVTLQRTGGSNRAFFWGIRQIST